MYLKPLLAALALFGLSTSPVNAAAYGKVCRDAAAMLRAEHTSTTASDAADVVEVLAAHSEGRLVLASGQSFET